MPSLSKRAISAYLKSDCKRRFLLDLFQGSGLEQKIRKEWQMPDRQPVRPGFALVSEAGDQWQYEKIKDLTDSFGSEWVRFKLNATPGKPYNFATLSLKEELSKAAVGTFLIEAEYDFDTPCTRKTFKLDEVIQRHGLRLAKLRPDIIIVQGSDSVRSEILPDGSIVPVGSADERLALRAIDIKLTTEPSAAYFCETVLYSVTLAAWLESNGLNKKYRVAANPAIWPGSYGRSPLIQAGEVARRRRLPEDKFLPPNLRALVDQGLEDELELTPIEVFVPRLQRIFEFELPELVAKVAEWQEVEWSVTSRCRNCDYLGMTWGDQEPASPRLCYPTATRTDHLSRLSFVPRGALRRLNSGQVSNVEKVSHLTLQAPVLESHPVLRSGAEILIGRAKSLAARKSGLVHGTPTSSSLSRRPDLAVYLVAEFDPSSAITGALAVRSVRWSRDADNRIPVRREEHRLVHARSLVEEEKVFILFLEILRQILNEAQKALVRPTVQVFIWDKVTYDHLTRLVGRYLSVVLEMPAIAGLSWLFPSPDLQIANEALIKKGSAVAVVADIVRTSVAVPVPHVHTLLATARWYHPSGIRNPDAVFFVNSFFEDPLGSQVPMERIHQLWKPESDPQIVAARANDWERLLRAKLDALNAIVSRLATDLRGSLIADAPLISDLKPPVLKSGVPPQGQVIYAYAALDSALARQETMEVLALPAKEREALFYSARLERLVVGKERSVWLEELGLPIGDEILVYATNTRSKEAKIKPGEFLRFLSPPNIPWFSEMRFGRFTANHGAPPEDYLPKFARRADGLGRLKGMTLSQLLRVEILAFDRVQCLLALRFANDGVSALFNWEPLRTTMKIEGPLMLDPMSGEYFLGKLERALKAIGVPPSAKQAEIPGSALGVVTRRTRQNRKEDSPVSFMLWGDDAVSAPAAREPQTEVHRTLDALNVLNSKQAAAVVHANNFRLTLIWGPPGTGKTHTLACCIADRLLRSIEERKVQRVLICTETYEALAEVVSNLKKLRSRIPILQNIPLIRIASGSREEIPEVTDFRPKGEQGDELRNLLATRSSSLLVFSTPQQVFNLAQDPYDEPQPLFDLIVLDEAAQMKTGSGILALSPLAHEGRVIVAGDPLQLPPISKVGPPSSLASLLGSMYGFFADFRRAKPQALEINYRSSSSIVSGYRDAGYKDLVPWSPQLQLNLVQGTDQLIDELLDPRQSCTCIVYADGESAQHNEFEVQLVCDIVQRFSERAQIGLIGEIDFQESEIAQISKPVDRPRFWNDHVGVVTVHRAQQAAITTRLSEIFPAAEEPQIRAAVDTVERFQGQQRNFIICSFSVGDSDLVRSEEDFLLSLNRFNVAISRARAKVIVVISRELLDHLSDDVDILRASRFLKRFVGQYCLFARNAAYPFKDGEKQIEIRTKHL